MKAILVLRTATRSPCVRRYCLKVQEAIPDDQDEGNGDLDRGRMTRADTAMSHSAPAAGRRVFV